MIPTFESAERRYGYRYEFILIVMLQEPIKIVALFQWKGQGGCDWQACIK